APPPPDLPSFPTRRSSDLCAQLVGRAVAAAARLSSRRTRLRRAKEKDEKKSAMPIVCTVSTQLTANHFESMSTSAVQCGRITGRSEEPRLNSSHRTISYAV